LAVRRGLPTGLFTLRAFLVPTFLVAAAFLLVPVFFLFFLTALFFVVLAADSLVSTFI